MKADNPYFYLPSSQLFPVVMDAPSMGITSSLLTEVRLAKELALKMAYSESLSIYNTLIEAHPDYPFLYLCRSLLKSLMDEDEGAYYDYQAAKKLDFNYHHLLEWISNAGEMVESEELLALREEDREDAQFYINRATLFVEHFDYENAIFDFTTAYAMANNPKVLISRGAVNMRMVRYDKALADFNSALKQEDDLIQGYVLRAKLYAAIQEIQLAETDFKKAISLAKDEASLYEERAQFYENIGNYEQAVADYSTVLAFNADDFYIYVLRADIYLKLADVNRALLDYDRAIELNPYYSDLYQYRGDVRQAMGDAKGAKEDYLKFEELEEE